jgi:hypothetical protein
MEPQILLSELSAGGQELPRADWTEAAKENVREVLTRFLQERHDQLIQYQPPEDHETLHLEDQLIKLHEVVGRTILFHKYGSMYDLPTKSGQLDWTLGSGTQSIRDRYDSDYALFVFLRDSYASTGRTVAIVAAAFLGVHMPGGIQFGFASLVDLQTGQIIWFNKLIRGFGDLRTIGPTREAVEQLLRGIPL